MFYTPGDLQTFKRRLAQEAELRRQGLNVHSTVPPEVRQILESESADPIIKGEWPGKYPTRIEELPDSVADLPNWEERDIRQLDRDVRNEMFGSWQTSLIPATIKITKILRREEQEKERQAQIEQARQAGYTVMSEPQPEVMPAAPIPAVNQQITFATAQDPNASSSSGLLERLLLAAKNAVQGVPNSRYLDWGRTFAEFKTQMDQNIQASEIDYLSNIEATIDFTIGDRNSLDIRIEFVKYRDGTRAQYESDEALITIYQKVPDDMIDTMADRNEGQLTPKEAQSFDQYLKNLAIHDMNSEKFHEFIHTNQAEFSAKLNELLFRKYGNQGDEIEAIIGDAAYDLIESVVEANSFIEILKVLTESNLWDEDSGLFTENLMERIEEKGFPEGFYDETRLREYSIALHSEITRKRDVLKPMRGGGGGIGGW